MNPLSLRRHPAVAYLRLVRRMLRSAAFLCASLLTAFASVAARDSVTLAPLYVCGHYPYDFEEPPIKPISVPD